MLVGRNYNKSQKSSHEVHNRSHDGLEECCMKRMILYFAFCVAEGVRIYHLCLYRRFVSVFLGSSIEEHLPRNVCVLSKSMSSICPNTI